MNENDRVLFQGQYVELSEEHKHYLTLTNRVCYLDYPNANNRIIEYGSTPEARQATLDKAKTLCFMPVYAKCAKNRKGEPTFKGHEVHQEGNEIVFDTIPIGVHEDVFIKKDDVIAVDGTPQRLWCIFARQRIWKRNKKAVAAIRRLFADGKLFNSWEIDTTQYSFKNGLKHLEEFEYIGNCMLGPEFAKPAYGQASAILDVASQDGQESHDSELMVAEALSQDLAERGENEVNFEAMKKELEETVDTAEDATIDASAEADSKKKTKTAKSPDDLKDTEVPVTPAVEEEEETPADSEGTGEGGSGATDPETPADNPPADESGTEGASTEMSALTDMDIRSKLERVLRIEGSSWPWISYLFPEEREAWVRTDQRNTGDLDYLLVKYEVVGEDVNVLTKTPVKLSVSPREVNQEISTRDERISALESSVAELSEYKAKYETTEAEKAEKERQKKRSACAAMVRKTKLFTEEEISAEPIKGFIDKADEGQLKVLIADKILASQTDVDTSAVEDAEIDQPVANLSVNEQVDYASTFMQAVRSRK